MRRLPFLALLVLMAVLGAACRQPEPVSSPTPLPELAEEATVEPAPATPQPATSPVPAAASPSAQGTVEPTSAVRTSTTEEDGLAPATTTAAPAPGPRAPRALLRVDDGRGDAGVEGPAYADLAAVLLEDDGERLRASVSLAAMPPATLADGEVIGVGIDLHLDGSGESEYQLFVDGGSDGWRAYLQTPGGFVDYPGEFVLRGRDLVLAVPWNALGSPSRGEVSAFLDWSRRRQVLNAVAQDRAPDAGRGRFER